MNETTIDNPEEDLYWEHSQHQEFLPNCSECYSEQKKIDEMDMMVGVDEEDKFEGDTLPLSEDDI